VAVYGGAGVPPGEIEYVDTTLLVTPGPLAFVRIELHADSTELTLSGPSNMTFQIQAASNLANPTWETIASNVVIRVDGMAQFLDASATNHPTRFYRGSTP
jgi:hypothetical protein